MKRSNNACRNHVPTECGGSEMVSQTTQLSVGGSTPAPPLQFRLRGEPELEIREISLKEAADFVAKHHYSKVMPKLNKVIFGLFQNNELVGTITFGWGVRPKSTVQCLFPSLDSKDYLEIGKLCLLDSQPKNTESRFITAAMRCLKRIKPDLKLVFTWADALWGKPGYIYQASNFLYGGYIQTEVYMDAEGRRIHPRQLRKKLMSMGEDAKSSEWLPKNGKSGVSRPKPFQMVKLGLKQVFGYQFRYIHFLCSKEEQDRLLSESTVTWNKGYPKTGDMKWKIRDGITKGPVACPQPKFSAAFDTEKEG